MFLGVVVFGVAIMAGDMQMGVSRIARTLPLSVREVAVASWLTSVAVHAPAGITFVTLRRTWSLLDASEINAIYNAGAAGKCKPDGGSTVIDLADVVGGGDGTGSADPARGPPTTNRPSPVNRPFAAPDRRRTRKAAHRNDFAGGSRTDDGFEAIRRACNG